jgi:hypothetical protein
VIDQAVIESGDPEEERCLVFRDGVEDGVGIESGQYDCAGACVQCAMQPYAQTVHVEERQAQNQAIFR